LIPELEEGHEGDDIEEADNLYVTALFGDDVFIISDQLKDNFDVVDYSGLRNEVSRGCLRGVRAHMKDLAALAEGGDVWRDEESDVDFVWKHSIFEDLADAMRCFEGHRTLSVGSCHMNNFETVLGVAEKSGKNLHVLETLSIYEVGGLGVAKPSLVFSRL